MLHEFHRQTLFSNSEKLVAGVLAEQTLQPQSDRPDVRDESVLGYRIAACSDGHIDRDFHHGLSTDLEIRVSTEFNA